LANNKKRVLIEQFAAPSRGIYDALPHSADEEFDGEEDEETTVPSDEPISASPQMAVQLSVAEPPVEDPDFVPLSVEELSNAASALARAVPADEVEWYYNQLHKLLDQATDRTFVEEDPTEEEEVQEESIRRMIRRSLLEVLSPEDEAELEDYRTGGIDYFGDIEHTEEEVQEEEGMSLEDLASEFGYSGPSGVRQEINRITNRMEYFAQNIRTEDLNALMDYAVGEYVDTLEATEALDADDLAELRAASSVVKGLDTFRFFFVSAFVLPAYKEVSKEAAQKLQNSIEELDLPSEINLALLNQTTGRAKKSATVINRKLNKLVAAGKIDTEEATAIAQKVASARRVLEQSSELSDDLIEKSLEKWQRTTKRKRAQLLAKAMEQAEGV
jgi:hypothetical protein